MLPSFSLTVLGCSSALPTMSKHQSAHILNVYEQLYLIDAGEGVQTSLKKCDINIMKINHIFISHLHGDHFFGLYGLISTFGMLGRERALEIYAPAPLKEIINFHCKMFDSYISYPIICHEVDTKTPQLIMENKVMEVHTIPLKHTIPTVGYLFKEKTPERNIHKDCIEKHNLSISEIVKIKNGDDIFRLNGDIIINEDVSYIPHKPRSFAYCCDTAYWERVAERIGGVNLLLHESTFLECDKKKARKRGHATALEAAKIAKMAGVKKLLLCHFSTRYNGKLEPFLDEAKIEFENSVLAQEFNTYNID